MAHLADNAELASEQLGYTKVIVLLSLISVLIAWRSYARG